MSEREKLYRSMHRSKIKVAVSASLLIGAAFVAIFMGFFKVEAGLSDKAYLNYIHFHVPVPASDGVPDGVIAHTVREISQNEGELAVGSTTLGSAVLIDMRTGGLKANFSAPAGLGLANIAHVENVNEWYAGAASQAPVVLVQFAQVEATETVRSVTGTYPYTVTYRNETGVYRTYTWDVSDPDAPGSKVDITGAIGPGTRVKGVIRLSYNATDDVPDYIIVSTNGTWIPSRVEHLFPVTENTAYAMHAMLANGSLAWSADSTTVNSVVEMQGSAFWMDIVGFPINSSHFVVELPQSKIAAGRIDNGDLAWRADKVHRLIGPTIDHSGDTLPDVTCVNFTSGKATCLDGTNGTALPEAAFDPVFVGNDVKPLNVDRRFGDSHDLILSWNMSGHEVRGYKHDASGIGLLWSVDTGDYNIYNWGEITRHYFSFAGPPLLVLHLGKPGQDDDEYRFVDPASGERLATWYKSRDEMIVGDFFGEWRGLEVIIVVPENGYEMVAIEVGSTRMLELNSMNLIIFGSALVIGLVSGLALVRARRTQSRLSREEDAMQPDLVVAEHSITTTSRTTRPLRSLSMAMLSIILASTLMFIVYIIVIGTGENYYLSQNYYAVRNGYITISLTLVSLPIISVLYNIVSPKSAMLYIKIQRFFFNKLFRGRKEYKVLVLDMNDYAKKFSIPLIISRSLFPLLVSLTLGLTVFGALASDTSGMATATGSMNLVWISEFEFYAGLTFIGSYLLMMFISPGAWLLDDSGVVYFEQPVDVHHPGDISKISDWLTGWLKGFFGFTALLNYYNLFAGIDLTTLVKMDDPLMAFLLIVFVFAIMIILSPILYGLIAMFSANASIIDDLEYNRERLYQALRKAGIDVTPKRLKDFFDKA